MAEINQVDILVKADVPAIVDNQQLLVYVPVATNSNYGIVKPDGDDLTVENGILKLKEGGSVQKEQLDKKVDKLTDSSTLIGDDNLKLYAQDNQSKEGYVSGSKDSLENSVAIRTAKGTLKSQRAQEDWDLVPLKQAKEIAQASNTPGAITDATVDANIDQNAIAHKSLEKWTYEETGNSEYVSVDRRIPIIAGKGIKFVKNDDLKAISIYTDLEAKLNENIFKNPEKTYIVWKGSNFPNSDTAQTIFDVGTVIDFGDGGAPTVITEALANTKVTHTYFDDTDYHIITITYPNTNARAIRANKYDGCTGLIYILTSRYITSIEEGAFSNCGKLDYLYLPNVSTIGNYAFKGMGTILDIDMPAVTSIGEYCFQGSGYSKHIVFPKLHTISVGALQIFEDVELGPDLEAVTIIKQFALNNCKVLTISDEKQSVLAEQNAFSNKLKRIYVPKSKYSTYISDWVAYYDKIAYKIDSYDLFLELGKCIPETDKGKANGVATLDASGKVPSSQLPSYVDDVIDAYIVGSTPFAADWLSLTAGGAPLTPEEGKIYVIVSEGAYSNNSYRWSGIVYAPVGSPIAVVQQTGQSTTDVMSQKSVTDNINTTQEVVNLNIEHDPDMFYFVSKQDYPSISNIPFKGTISWGDGTIENFEVGATLSHERGQSGELNIENINQLLIWIDPFDSSQKVTITGDTFDGLDARMIQLPEDFVTGIGDGALVCGIEEITIPASVTQIGNAFKNTTGGEAGQLKRITLLSTTPPTFSGTLPDNVEKIIVPKSAINAYKAATGWSTYANKIVYEVDSSDIDKAITDLDVDNIAYLNKENTFKNSNGFEKTITVAPILQDNAYGDRTALFGSDAGNNVYYNTDSIRKVYNFDSSNYLYKFPTKSGTLALIEDLTAKLDKPTVADSNYKIVTYNGTNSGTLDYSNAPNASSIMQRDADGRAQVVSGVSGNDIVNYSQLETKYDKTGGTIGGNVVITGDLTVNGTQHINNTENLNVENAMIYSNTKGATLATNGGIGIKKNATDVYGIVYDPTSDSVKLGIGKSDANGRFTFNANEGQPVAIRDDSSKFTNNNLVKWDSESYKFVDAGKNVENLVDKLPDLLRSQAYVRNANGEDSGLAYTYTNEGNSLALRNASGQLQVSTPLQDNDAANKKFVEDAIAVEVETSLMGA